MSVSSRQWWRSVETTVRLEKQGTDEYAVVFDAAGDVPEKEYVFRKVDEASKQDRKNPEREQQ